MEVKKTAAGRRRTLMMGVVGDAAPRCAASASLSCKGVCEECVRSVDFQRVPRRGSLHTGLLDEPQLAQPAVGRGTLKRVCSGTISVFFQQPFGEAKNVSPAPVIFYFLPVRLSEAISPLF